MEVLVCLAKDAGEVVSKERLMQTVWADTFVTDEVLTNSIWELRKAFQDDAKNPKVIQTVFKKGYRLIAPVFFEGKTAEIGSTSGPSQSEADALSRPHLDESGLQGGEKRKWIGAVMVLAFILAVAAGIHFLRRAPSVPSAGPRIVPLTSLPGSEIQPALSPDGSQVAFAWDGEKGDNWDIYLKVLGSEKVVRLTTDASKDYGPVWSPDGRQIAFIRNLGNQTNVVLIPALSGAERSLYKVRERFESWPPLAWSPDGKHIALTETPLDSEESRIVLISWETGERQTLLSSPRGSVYFYSNPRFSPDGRVLLARSWPSADIDVIDLASGKVNRLGLSKFNLKSFELTADGRAVVFSTRTSNFLWRASLSGGQPERVAWIESGASYPSISRRGNSLVYSQARVDENIWKIDLSRNPVVPQVFISSTRRETSPQFSFDGSRILFRSNRASISPEIWICEIDRSNPRQITFPSTSDGEAPPSKDCPRWSPDGQSIAFNWDAEGNKDIYVVSVEGGKPKRLTTEPSSDVRPSWSRDGKWVYFGSNRSGEWQIWKVPATGGQALQVTKHGGREALESPDGKFVYYSKDFGITGLWRVHVDGGADEALIFDGPLLGYWSVLDDGVYFLAREPMPTVKFHSFITRQTKEVASVGKNIDWAGPGFSVSSDGKQIIYAQIDRVEHDLMLVENFR
jgi:Tol biopolymer transport system component